MICVGVSVYTCVCLALRVMLNGMTKVATPLLASSSSLGCPIGAPRFFFNSKYLFLDNAQKPCLEVHNALFVF